LKQEPVPAERRETVRQEIIRLLDGRTLSVRDISTNIRISEKEVYGHLEHIRKTINRDEHKFHVAPSVCRKCGFVFRKRDRLKKPGRCPVCRSELIQEAQFSITADR
jgi:transcriptional regulator